MVTHGTITSLTDEEEPKILTSKEWLIAQGEPLEGISEHFVSFIEAAITNLPSNEHKKLAGNAYEATCFGYFVLYCLSNVSMKDETASLSATAAGKDDLKSLSPLSQAAEDEGDLFGDAFADEAIVIDSD